MKRKYPKLAKKTYTKEEVDSLIRQSITVFAFNLEDKFVKLSDEACNKGDDLSEGAEYAFDEAKRLTQNARVKKVIG